MAADWTAVLIQGGIQLFGTAIGGAIAAFTGFQVAERNAKAASQARAEERRAALLSQRATDLRELGGTLPDILAAAQEIIWDRVTTEKLMPKSDPRSMRLTQLIQRTRFLRVVVDDGELRGLVGKVRSTAERLADSNRDDMDKDMPSANQALTAALDKVADLLQAAERESYRAP